MAEISEGVVIRRYAETDLDDICFIESQYYLCAATREEQIANLRNPSWVAEEDGQVIGHLITRPELDGTLVHSIVVAAPHRGKGIGSRLILELERHITGKIALYVEALNSIARLFYAKHGYQRVAYLANYWGPGYDVVKMEKGPRN